VRIGVSTAYSNMLIDYIIKYREQYPNVKISIINSNSEELLKRLEQREIDIALLLRTRNSEQYKMKSLKRQQYVVIIPTSWSSSFPSQHTTFEQIAQYPFIMLGAMEGVSFTEDMLKAFDHHHVKPNIIIECKDVMMVASLVSRGVGLSVIPRMDYSSPFLEHTTYLELKHFDVCVEPVIVKLKDGRIPKAASQFWETVE
jgi:DNA-binding transcriptional LysR family regulator